MIFGRTVNPPDKPARAIRLEVRKEGHRFYGDLVWSTGDKWVSWQSGFRTLKALTQSARCTYEGEIVRV